MAPTVFGFGPGGYLRPPAREPKLLHPLVLAYAGDAVYELFIRQYLISLNNHRPHHLHTEATRFVSAKAQARSLERLMPMLTEEEREMVHRGRNAKSGTVPKNADVLEYRHSTAFECLIGYLYYSGRHERMLELMERTLAEPAAEPEGAAVAARAKSPDASGTETGTVPGMPAMAEAGADVNVTAKAERHGERE